MAAMAVGRRAAISFVFVTVMLDILALGVMIPVLPKLIESFVGQDTGTAAKIFGNFGTLFAAMQFICSPVIGVLSDRFGRRPVILASNLGLGADYVLMALAPSLRWLVVGRILSGLTASSIPTAFAYIADVKPPEERAAAFGMIGAAFGIGFVLGPAMGGILGHIGPRLPFWVAAGLSLANACWGFFVLPESLAREKREPFSWKRASPIGALKLLTSHAELWGLATVHFLGQLAHVVLPSVFVLYAGERYHWDELDVGLCLAGVGVATMIVQAGLVRRIVAALGERKSLLVGLLFGASGFAAFGLAPTGKLFFVGIPLMAMWGLGGASLQGLMTRHIGPSEQGQLQGACASLTAIAELIGPGVFTRTFAMTIRPEISVPGAAFLLASLFVGLSWAVAWRATQPARAAPAAT